MSVKLIIKNVIIFLLIILWVYAAISKLSDFDHFKVQMHNQPLPGFVQTFLIYLLPSVELLIAGLLTVERSQCYGLVASGILMFFFTGYVGLALFNFFSYVPCSCGGILEHMTWLVHLIFNIIFLLLSLIAIYIYHKERRITA